MRLRVASAHGAGSGQSSPLAPANPHRSGRAGIGRRWLRGGPERALVRAGLVVSRACAQLTSQPTTTSAVTLTPTCLAFLVRPQGQPAEVLLGHKKRGFGAGRVGGLGGHLKAGESAFQAAAREITEESGVQVELADLNEMVRVVFRFSARPNGDQRVSVFTAERWRGQPAESDEIAPEWFGIQALPFDRMWDDARLPVCGCRK